jgi:medium-chain acyl-[acyl-carrier-protein] hydrolase
MMPDKMNLHFVAPGIPLSNETVRLFCFPYAGGSGAVIYNKWQQNVPDWLNICPVELPGRGRLLAKAQPHSLVELAHDIASALYPYTSYPYALFGHSMGAMIAYEVANYLEDSTRNTFHKLIASGCRAPFIARRSSPVSDLSDQDFLTHIHNLNGTPPEVFADAELIRFVLPTLRADFSMCERYHPQSRRRMKTPITALTGDQDTEITNDDIQAWTRLTSGAFRTITIPGGHFFIKQSEAITTDVICKELESFRTASV